MATTDRLVNTTPELKAGVGAVQSDIVFDALASFVDDAEQNHIIPAIGYGLYDALREDTGLTDKQTRAKTLLQKAIANFGIHYYVAFGAVQITESGISVLKTDRQLPASDKKTLQLRSQSRADGFKSLENVIIYLEAFPGDFPQYISDAAHLLNRGYYVNTTAEFSAGYNLQGNAELFASLKSVMRRVEENNIDTLLGNTLSTAIRSAILNNSTSTQQKTLIAKIATPVALLTVAEAITYNLVSIEARGLVTNTLKGNIENVEQSTEGDLSRLQSAFNTLTARGMSEIGKLTKWLNDNAADYPDYVPQDQQARNNINDQPIGVYFL